MTAETKPVTDRSVLLCAYGYLWLVDGDSGRDRNIRFSFQARRQLSFLLTPEERAEGITIARNLAKANGLPFQGVPR